MFRSQFARRSLLTIGILLGLAALPMASAQEAAGTGLHPPSGLQPPVTSDPPAAPAPAQKVSAAKLSDFEWLEGRWRGEWGPRAAEQVWLAPKAGLMVGIFRLTEGDKPLVIELFTLVQKPDGINFYLRHFTSALVPWEKSDATILSLANADGKKIDFENPASGMPKRAVLTRIDADTYVSRSEIVPQKGDMQVIEITYHRLLPDGAAPSAGNGGHRKKP